MERDPGGGDGGQRVRLISQTPYSPIYGVMYAHVFLYNVLYVRYDLTEEEKEEVSIELDTGPEHFSN